MTDWIQLNRDNWDERAAVHTRSADGNHGLGEIVTAPLDAGLRITMLLEHDSVPWRPFREELMEEVDGEYRLRSHPERVPLTYTLQAVNDA